LQLGNNIGRNRHLQSLTICPDGLDEDDEIFSTKNLDLFISSITNNRSLKELYIQDYDFSRARLGLLHPFIIENDSLVDLQLYGCGFGSHDLQMLAAAFSQRRNPSSIKALDISGRNINDESIPTIVDICGYCPHLQQLDLTYSRFGIQGLRILATLLASTDCTLRRLHLDGNTIDDEGARVLANSLVNNKRLKRLGLDRKISARGWKYFLDIVRHKSNIDATSSSNHTLETLWDIGFGTPRDLPEDLKFCLDANKEKDKKGVIRKKILYFHLNNNVDLFAEDQEILPNALGWIGKDYDECSHDDKNTRGTAFYRIMKSHPDLCNVITFDRKMRYQLEAEVATLKAENEELRQKVEQLTMGK